MSQISKIKSSSKARRLRVNQLLAAMMGIGFSAGAQAISNSAGDLAEVAGQHTPQAEHIDQAAINAVADQHARFELAFEVGDELFEVTFNALDGVGADVGNGERFTRVPRADLAAWANQTPPRATGPNGSACNECHALPADDGAGPAALNVHRDPTHSGIGAFIQRNTPHLFGQAGLQLLGEEMTTELQAIRDAAEDEACLDGGTISRTLKTKGVDYGTISASCGSIDTSGVEGVSADLVVRPFQWKGNFLTVREFNRDASLNELGMQPVEMTGPNFDGDGDGIVNEMTIGDQTALAIYVAAQARPTTRVELAELGLIPAMTNSEINSINRGRAAFMAANCDSCHTMRMDVDNPIFSEPSQHPDFRENVFPSGQDPITEGVDPADPVAFNLLTDIPDNQEVLPNGSTLGNYEANNQGGAIVRAFSDLKLHDMGAGLAEAIDETGSGASTWMTKELWGLGSTAPYMHDGRSTTITEAILEHGGEATASRDKFVNNTPAQRKQDLVNFLNNLVLFKEGVGP